MTATILLVPAAGCGGEEGLSSDPERACELLAAERPVGDLTEPPDLTTPPTLGGQSLGALLGESRFDRSTHAIIYLDPQQADELEAMGDEAGGRAGIEVGALFDQEESFEELRRLFRGQEKLIDSVTPEILPPSVRVAARSDEALDDLLDWADRDPRTYLVVDVRSFARDSFSNIHRRFERPLAKLVDITERELRAAFELVRDADDDLTLDQALSVPEAVSDFMDEECDT